MSWVQSECGLSEYTSGAMMKAANVAEANSWLTKNTHLISVEAINRLFAKSTPTEVRDRVESLLVDGQRVTVADIRKMKGSPIARHHRHGRSAAG
jgi:hypothetical protein